VPRTRRGFRTRLFERYRRRQAELDEAIGELCVYGVSTRRVGEVMEELTGVNPRPSTVSRVLHTWEEECRAWKERPLQVEYRYAFADGTYFTVIYDTEGRKTPILAIVGITMDGKRDLLAFTVGDRENQQAWEDLLDDLKRRGVQRVGLWVSDGHQALINALELKFPDAARQRCVQHKIENVLSYVPKQQQERVAPELKGLFYQDRREGAEQAYVAFCAQYEPIYPTAVACLPRDHDACFRF